jgi:hypothetical protein
MDRLLDFCDGFPLHNGDKEIVHGRLGDLEFLDFHIGISSQAAEDILGSGFLLENQVPATVIAMGCQDTGKLSEITLAFNHNRVAGITAFDLIHVAVQDRAALVN